MSKHLQHAIASFMELIFVRFQDLVMNSLNHVQSYHVQIIIHEFDLE